MTKMSETQQQDSGDDSLQDADEKLKRGLLKRVALAGALVVALLGGLAVFDALHVPQPAIQTAALAPETTAEATAKPTEPEPQTEGPREAESAATETKEDVAAEPERTATPLASLPPAKAERPLTPPARARPAAIRPSEPVAAIHKPEPARELARHAPPSRPLTRATEAPRQYVVQMGVFNNVANAEEFRAKLEASGVPAQIEARVQVGPFATRQEAEQAREKLRGLGMENGLLMAIRR